MKTLGKTKLTIGGVVVAALIATPAMASPPPAPPSWTGWYVGGNVGASFGNVKTDYNVAPYTFTEAPAFVTFPGVAGSDQRYPSGFTGGGQIGYNWQFSPIWVVGFEADFQGVLETDSNNLSNPLNGTPILQVDTARNAVTGTAATTYTAQIDWFGTVRLRAGYVWGNGNVFSYATGGLAYGEVKINGTNAVSGSLNGTIPLSITDAFGHSQVNTGWVMGYGTEGKLLIPGWTLKAETLYMDLGHLDTTGTTSSVPVACCTLTGGQVTTHSHFTDGIFRVGLNYQFH
jgi:outer membrane immunogenic protein